MRNAITLLRSLLHSYFMPIWSVFLFSAVLLTGCAGDAGEPAEAREQTVRGQYLGSQFDGQVAVIHHEAIPNVMEAMKMGFKLVDPQEISSLQSGDPITFTLLMDGEDWTIRNVRRLPDTVQLDLPDLDQGQQE